MPLVLLLAEMLCVNPQLVVEHDYDKDVLHGYVDQNLLQLNICQETIITVVFNVVAQGEGIIFFLHDRGGSGKTFVYNVLLASVPWDRHIAIRVASSGITTLLLEGGRTSHSFFKIPIAIGRDSMCSILVQSDFVKLLKK
jgi:hypothetical protein